MALEHSAEGLWMFEAKEPVSIHVSPEAADGGPLAMAGVWKDSEVPSFAIVTCPARGEADRKSVV